MNKLIFIVTQSCQIKTSSAKFDDFDSAKYYALKLYDSLPIEPYIAVIDTKTGEQIDAGKASVFFDLPKPE